MSTGWVLVVVVAIGAAILAWIMRRPEKNVGRDAFCHWIEALARYYEDGARLEIVGRSADVVISFCRSGTNGDGCKLELGISPTSPAIEAAESLMGVCESELDGMADDFGEAVIVGYIGINNIWATGAGARAARIAHLALDAIGIDESERFNLLFSGARSVARTAQARERMRYLAS